MNFVKMTVAAMMGDPDFYHLHDLTYGDDIAFVHACRETGASFEELTDGRFMVTIENSSQIFDDKSRAISSIEEFADEIWAHDAELEIQQNKDTLTKWYVETIGYDPFEEGMTIEEVQKIRSEYEEAAG